MMSPVSPSTSSGITSVSEEISTERSVYSRLFRYMFLSEEMDRAEKLLAFERLLASVERDPDYNEIQKLYEQAFMRDSAYVQIIVEKFPVLSLNTQVLHYLVSQVMVASFKESDPILHNIFEIHVRNGASLDYTDCNNHFLYHIANHGIIAQFLCPILERCLEARKHDLEAKHLKALSQVPSLVHFPPGILPISACYSAKVDINDLESRFNRSRTLLGIAVDSSNKCAVEFLMKLGCDPLQLYWTSTDGSSVLSWDPVASETIFDRAVKRGLHPIILKYRPDLELLVKKS